MDAVEQAHHLGLPVTEDRPRFDHVPADLDGVEVRISHSGWSAQGGFEVFIDDPDVRVTAFRVEHPPISPAVGYRFDYAGRSVVLSGDTRRSVRRFAHDLEFDEVLGDQKPVPFIAHDQRRSHIDLPREAVEPLSGRLQQGRIVHQGEKLLRIGAAREGPEACSGSPGKDDRLE